MLIVSNAKVNAGLRVLRKRSDGFHDIESIFLPFHQLADLIEIIPFGRKGEILFQTTGLKLDGKVEENTCVRAYKLLANSFDLPGVKIHLHKIIPSGSGFGGASSNGSFTLILLNQLFELGLEFNQLFEFCLELSSDSPFFLVNKPALVEGRGERILELELDMSFYQIRPYLNSSSIQTKDAYQQIKAAERPAWKEEAILNPLLWKKELKNDFEQFFFSSHPELSEIKDRIYADGAIYASMTGSGSAFYGLFKANHEESTSRKKDKE